MRAGKLVLGGKSPVARSARPAGSVVLAGLAAMAAALLATGTAVAGEKFTVVERALTDAVANVGTTRGDAPGNVLTFVNPVFDAANRLQLGTDQGYCVRVAPGRSWECTWTLLLKDGQINCAGPFLDAGDSDLVVTGGTGRYAGVRGTLHLHARDAKGSAYDFRYELL